MGLFKRTPTEIKQLEQEIITAKVALGLASKLDDAHQSRVIETATSSVRNAAKLAAAAGHADEARAALEKRATPPNDPVGSEAWPVVVAEGLAALEH
jgi:hypothetical protein